MGYCFGYSLDVQVVTLFFHISGAEISYRAHSDGSCLCSGIGIIKLLASFSRICCNIVVCCSFGVVTI